VERETFVVDSIHCDGCERTISQALGGIPGVETVEPDARTNTVKVEFSPADVSRVDIAHRLADAGFPVLDAIDRDTDGESSRGLARIGVLALIIASVALIGYAGYVVYPRFDLPPVEGAAVFGLAAAAGVAAFFSPCSFPLLLAILGRHASARARDIEPVASRPALLGGVVALGAGGFLLTAGLLIAAGGGALVAQVTFDSVAGVTLRAIVGVVLVGLGLIQAEVIGLSFRRAEGVARPVMRRQARLRRDHPLAGHALFGFGYVLAGFG
jgi:cytochrome c biogenesis protein CcdA/copper chaperone CopZ